MCFETLSSKIKLFNGFSEMCYIARCIHCTHSSGSDSMSCQRSELAEVQSEHQKGGDRGI